MDTGSQGLRSFSTAFPVYKLGVGWKTGQPRKEAMPIFYLWHARWGFSKYAMVPSPKNEFSFFKKNFLMKIFINLNLNKALVIIVSQFLSFSSNLFLSHINKNKLFFYTLWCLQRIWSIRYSPLGQHCCGVHLTYYGLNNQKRSMLHSTFTCT